jgi:hypothetical protein
MNIILKVVISLLATITFSSAFAINVNVHSTSSKIDGLGFTVNGSKHGGMGANYHGNNMPKGSYTFGLRVKGKDIGCLDKSGKKNFKLSRSSAATLSVKGGKCTVKINSK